LTLLPILLLGGCNSLPAVAGLGAGAIAGAGSGGNVAVGYAVAVGTAAAVDYGVKYYGRTRQRAEQEAIATAAAPLEIGQSATWRIEHTIPYGNENGELHVVRRIANPLAECKQIAFSVTEEGEKDKKTGQIGPPVLTWYTAELCRQDTGWRWASAEPAVERWGFLQ
jgi:hypothetical protein